MKLFSIFSASEHNDFIPSTLSVPITKACVGTQTNLVARLVEVSFMRTDQKRPGQIYAQCVKSSVFFRIVIWGDLRANTLAAGDVVVLCCVSIKDSVLA